MKRVAKVCKLQFQAGGARPGPALASAGINMPQFCQAFNDATKDRKGEVILNSPGDKSCPPTRLCLLPLFFINEIPNNQLNCPVPQRNCSYTIDPISRFPYNPFYQPVNSKNPQYKVLWVILIYQCLCNS